MEEHVRLPEGKTLSPVFLPQARQLDEVLNRPSLDERLPSLLEPELSDTEFLKPNVLSELRKNVQHLLLSSSVKVQGREREILKKGADILKNDVLLDEELQAALAALLKG